MAKRHAQAALAGLDEIVDLMLRSVELGNEGRWGDALAKLDRAVAINPLLPLARINRARAFAELGRYEEALDDCDFFLRYVARLAPVEAVREEIVARALNELGQCLAESPRDVATLFRRGNVFMKSRLYAPALADYAALLEQDARHVDALNNRGRVLAAQGLAHESVAAFEAAAAGAPQRREFWFNLGNVRQSLGCLGEARAAYRQALALSPDFAEAHLEIGHCALAAGEFSAGWRDFEWRWRTGQMAIWHTPSEAPRWLGAARPPATRGRRLAPADLAGRTLLVWAEQGAGDTLQFIRFVPRLAECAQRVVLRVPHALCRLLAGLDSRIEVLADSQPIPPHDAHCPLMSLPLALGIDDAVASAAYLHAEPSDVALWRERLGGTQRLRVGLAWAGRQFGQTNPTRDVALGLLAPLAALDVDWVCLQKELPSADAEALAAWPGLRRFGDEDGRPGGLGDYSDTAALIANLDLIISVDTSVAHLAGALGKPCWLMLRHSGEWRWQRERSDSPWYPTLRLFRQKRAGDWCELVARLAGELAVLVVAPAGRSQTP